MDVKTYRAATMQEALAMVRRELGPEAAVLHTREVRNSRLFGLLPGARQIEVTASASISVPSRLPPRRSGQPATQQTHSHAAHQAYGPPHQAYGYTAPREPIMPSPEPPAVTIDRYEQGRPSFTAPAAPAAAKPVDPAVQDQLGRLQSMVEDLYRRSRPSAAHDLPPRLFNLFTDLIEAELSEEYARELIGRVRAEAEGHELADEALLKARMARLIEDEIQVAGAIQCQPGQRRIVALVGPTGVGKTTTIAKLAANFRLREKRRVGLITVDTYRIAAVEQLRTYADIIDLPMHVVSTPKEMREAIEQFAGFDLILVDTAGRSPKDEVKLQELKSFLGEAQADEVHLVLSSVASASSLRRTAAEFSCVGTSALILTKLDEATGLGNLLPLLRETQLPLTYLTNGQNVPDDIEAANSRRLAHVVLGLESADA